MPFNNVDVFTVIAVQEIIHIKRAFKTGGASIYNRVNFQTKWTLLSA